MTKDEARSLAQAELSEQRFYHTECVADAAQALAALYGADAEKAAVTAFLHDVLKEREPADLLQMIRGSAIINVDDVEKSPAVWHGFAAGEYIEKELGLGRDIADAVRYHTTGRADMSLLEKVVFLADYTSRDREFRGAEEVRKLCLESADLAVLAALRNQLCHLVKKGVHINENSLRAFNFLVDAGLELQ